MSDKQLQALKEDAARLNDLLENCASRAEIMACLADLNEVASNASFE